MTSHDFWPSVIKKIKEELALYDAKKIWPPLRQMFYRLVAREALTNTNSMYKQLSAQTARARESGILPIDCFRDDSPIADVDDEYLSPEQTVDNYLEMLQNLPENYTGLPRWYNQPDYVEIWIEKNAMVSEFESIIDEAGLEVRLVPHGGYVSLTQLNESVNRLYKFIKIGKGSIHILYFGDFDPSGFQMFEDIKSRLVNIWGLKNGNLELVTKNKEYRFSFDLQRVAVNKNHVIEHDLPKDPQSKQEEIKLNNDTRTDGFKELHGRVYATELDTLPVWVPDVFKNMVIQAVNQYFDEDIYSRELEAHKEEHSAEAIALLVKEKTKKFLEEATEKK
jgi:hypothetical protein